MGRRFYESTTSETDEDESIDEFIFPGAPLDPAAFLDKDTQMEPVNPKKR